MATAAFVGTGSVFDWATVPLAEVKTLSGPKNNATEIDVTNWDSTGSYKEVLMGLLDAGEITITCNYVPADTAQVAMIADYASSTPRAWELTLPDTGGCVISGNGYVKSYSFDVPTGDAVKINFTIRCTGATTVTP